MLIEILHENFADRRKRNPRYSLRAFARTLKIDSSTLSALMRGKRPLTPKTAKRLMEKLGIQNSAIANENALRDLPEQKNAKAAPSLVLQEKSPNTILAKPPVILSLWKNNEGKGADPLPLLPKAANEFVERSFHELTS